MTDIEKQQAVEELITTTYENMGFAVLEINSFAPGIFKLEMMGQEGVKEVLVTVLLHMGPLNGTVKRQQT